MEVFECISPRVSYSFLQRMQRRSPGDGANRTERQPPSSVELVVGNLPRETSMRNPIHQLQRPKQIADVHAHIGRHRRGQTVDESSGDIVVFERRGIAGLAFRADQ